MIFRASQKFSFSVSLSKQNSIRKNENYINWVLLFWARVHLPVSVGVGVYLSALGRCMCGVQQMCYYTTSNNVIQCKCPLIAASCDCCCSLPLKQCSKAP